MDTYFTGKQKSSLENLRETELSMTPDCCGEGSMLHNSDLSLSKQQSNETGVEPQKCASRNFRHQFSHRKTLKYDKANIFKLLKRKPRPISNNSNRVRSQDLHQENEPQKRQYEMRRINRRQVISIRCVRISAFVKHGNVLLVLKANLLYVMKAFNNNNKMC